MLSDNSLSIEAIKYIQEFRFVVLSTQAVYLYDLRYSSLPISEFSININYKGMNVKNLINTEIFSERDYFIGIDLTKKDTSHVLFDIAEVKQHDFFNNFANINLIGNNAFNEDVCGILDGDTYIYFSVDNFSSVSCNFVNLLNISDPKAENYLRLDSNFIENPINEKNLNDEIKKLFENNYKNNIFKKESNGMEKFEYENLVEEANELKGDDNEVEMMESSSEEEADEEFAFGYAKIKGKKKKLFEVKSNRNLVEKLLFEENEVKVSEDEESIESESNKEINDTIKQILNNFKF
jgi:hypothetical protein